MKKFLYATTLSLFSTMQAMEELAEEAVKAGSVIRMGQNIQLPSAQVLKETLDYRGFDSLAQQTNIHLLLSNRRLSATEIYQKVSVALGTCPSYINEPESAWTLGFDRRGMVEAILEKHPMAIRELEKKGFFKMNRQHGVVTIDTHSIEKN